MTPRNDRPGDRHGAWPTQARLPGDRLQHGRRGLPHRAAHAAATRWPPDRRSSLRSPTPSPRRHAPAAVGRCWSPGEAPLVRRLRAVSPGGRRLGYAVATMPNAKGLFDEQHANFIGTYWGPVGSPGCAEIVESADCRFSPARSSPTTRPPADAASHHLHARISPARLRHHARPNLQRPAARFPPRSRPAQVSKNSASLSATTSGIAARAQRDTAAPTRRWYCCSPAFKACVAANSCLVAETGDSWFNGRARPPFRRGIRSKCNTARSAGRRRDARLRGWANPNAASSPSSATARSSSPPKSSRR